MSIPRHLVRATVKQHLQNCHLLAGIKCPGFTAKQLQHLRHSLPPTASLIVAKNKWVLKSLEGTPWESLKPCMKGTNAFLFVHSEDVPSAISPYVTFRKAMGLEGLDFSGAVFEGMFHAADEFKDLETMQTRSEFYSDLVSSLMVPTSAFVETLDGAKRGLVFLLDSHVKKLGLKPEGGQ